MVQGYCEYSDKVNGAGTEVRILAKSACCIPDICASPPLLDSPHHPTPCLLPLTTCPIESDLARSLSVLASVSEVSEGLGMGIWVLLPQYGKHSISNEESLCGNQRNDGGYHLVGEHLYCPAVNPFAFDDAVSSVKALH